MPFGMFPRMLGILTTSEVSLRIGWGLALSRPRRDSASIVRDKHPTMENDPLLRADDALFGNV